MRTKRLTIQGFLAFPDLVTVDFDALPAGIYAIWGDNGEGKTTLMEAIPGAIFREFPSRNGGLADYATRRDAFIEVDMDMADTRLLARVNVDSQTRGSDAVLQVMDDGKWRVINEGAKLKTYDAAIRDRFPPLSQLLASAIGVQKRTGSFASLEQAERKDLFQRLIGADRYIKLSELAKEKRDAAAAEAERARVKLSVLHVFSDPGVLDAAREDAAAAEDAAGVANAVYQDAHRAQVAAMAAVSEAEEALIRVQQDARQVETDRRRYATLSETVSQLSASVIQAEATYKQAIAAIERRVLDTRDTAAREWRAAKSVITDQEGLLAARADIETAVALVADLERQVSNNDTQLRDHRTGRALALGGGVRAAQRALDDAVALNTERQQYRRAIESSVSVPCHAADAFLGCRFLVDVAIAHQALAAGVDIDVAPLESALTQAHERERQYDLQEESFLGLNEKLRSLLGTVRPVAAKATAVAVADAQCAAARQTLIKCELSVKAAQDDAAQRTQDAGEVKEARLRELSENITTAAAEQATIDQSRWTIVDIEVMNATARAVEMRTLRDGAAHARDAAMRAASEAASAVTHARERVTTVQAQRETWLEINAAEQAAAAESAEWNQLYRAYHRNGLPMIEIDSAGPIVTEHTNALLAGVLGGRFSVRLITQTPTSDGSGLKDVFDIEVYDGEKGGATRALSDLSGGQEIIIDESLKSAIAMFMNQQNVLPIRTCIRDETTGALHHNKIADYVQLLRNVREQGGFEKLLFVSHSIDAAVSADGILWCHDGQVDVCTAPYDIPALMASHKSA